MATKNQNGCIDKNDTFIVKRLVAMHLSAIVNLINDAKLDKRNAEEIIDQLQTTRDAIYEMYNPE